MKVWMDGLGEILYLNAGGNIDLRNTSQERAVDVKFPLAKRLLLKGIVFGQLNKAEELLEEGQELIKKGLAIPAKQTPLPKAEKVVEQEEQIVDSWEEMKWHSKKKFAQSNGFDGEDLKEETLDNWYKGFIKNNEI